MKIVELAILENWLSEQKAKQVNDFFNEEIFIKCDVEYFIKEAMSWSSERKEEHIKEGTKKYNERKGDYCNKYLREYGFEGNKVIADLDEVIIKLPFLKNFKIERFIPIEEKSTLGVTSAMLEALNKFEVLNNDMANLMDRTRQFNDKCDVHIGGGLLMRVRKVKVCEDYCTEFLQDELNDGWMILAVCVQPDGRRPDYVLGKYDE